MGEGGEGRRGDRCMGGRERREGGQVYGKVYGRGGRRVKREGREGEETGVLEG